MSGALAANTRPKVSSNTGGYHLFNLAKSIPVAKTLANQQSAENKTPTAISSNQKDSDKLKQTAALLRRASAQKEAAGSRLSFAQILSKPRAKSPTRVATPESSHNAVFESAPVENVARRISGAGVRGLLAFSNKKPGRYAYLQSDEPTGIEVTSVKSCPVASQITTPINQAQSNEEQPADTEKRSIHARRQTVASLPATVKPSLTNRKTSLGGVFQLFSDRVDEEPEPEEAPPTPEPPKQRGFSITSFMNGDLSSEEEEIPVVSRPKPLMFRRVAIAIMVWNVFLKRPRMPPEGRFRHAGLLILKFLRLQRSVTSAKALHSKKAGLHKKATWNALRELFQTTKHVRLQVSIKLRPPSSRKLASSEPSSHHSGASYVKSTLAAPVSPAKSLSPPPSPGRVRVGPASMLAATVKPLRQRSRESKTSHETPEPPPSIIESIGPSEKDFDSAAATHEMTVAFSAGEPPSETVDTGEALQDWLSVQTGILSSIQEKSATLPSYSDMEDGRLYVDGR